MKTRADVLRESELKIPDDEGTPTTVAYITEGEACFEIPDGWGLDRANALKVRDWLTAWFDTPVGESEDRREKRSRAWAALGIAYGEYMNSPLSTEQARAFARHLVTYVETLAPEDPS